MPVKKYNHTTYSVKCDICDDERMDVEHEDWKQELEDVKSDGWMSVNKVYDGYCFICPKCIKEGNVL